MDWTSNRLGVELLFTECDLAMTFWDVAANSQNPETVQRNLENACKAYAAVENLFGGDKGKGTSGRPARPKVPIRWTGPGCPVVGMKRGNAREAKGAGHPRRDRLRSTGNRRNRAVMVGGGSLQWVARVV
jgi:hypothetical protein